MFQASSVGILGFAAIAACWALAVVLYPVGMPGSVRGAQALAPAGRRGPDPCDGGLHRLAMLLERLLDAGGVERT